MRNIVIIIIFAALAYFPIRICFGQMMEPAPKTDAEIKQEKFEELRKRPGVVEKTDRITIKTQKGNPSYPQRVTVEDPETGEKIIATISYIPLIEKRKDKNGKWTWQTVGMANQGVTAWSYQTGVSAE